MSQHQDMTTAQLVAYYQSLLIVQYATKSRALATIAALVGQAIADQIINAVQNGFDITKTSGAQLDLIATYRGALRTVFGLNPSRKYFSMPAYADSDIGTVKGFATYQQTQIDITWYWTQYQDPNQPAYSMNDDELRRCIQYRAALQGCNFSIGALDVIFFAFFAAKVNVIDNKDMTMTIHHDITDQDTLFSILNQTNALPRPAGVAVTVQES